MRIGITGVPGSGKTTLSKLVCEKYNLQYISINDLINEKEFWTTIDARDDAKVVNMIALKKELQNVPENCVVEGHLLCEFPVPVDILIILRVPTKLLGERLTERKYNEFKMKSNIYSELLDYCTDRAKCKYCNSPTAMYEVLTSKTIEECMGDIDQIINGNGQKFKAPWVNLSEFDMWNVEIFINPFDIYILLWDDMPANLRNKNHNKRVPNKFHVLIRRRTFLKTKRNNIQSELKKSFNERYILAAKNGDIDEIKFCIEKNVDINYKDSDHKTALFYAAKYERIEAVKYLVENGADVNIKDKDGRTILMCLSGKYDNLYKSCYEKMMTEHDKNLKIISFLIEKGALVNLKDNFGNDAMQYALLDNIGNYNNREINLLIRSGADLYSFGAAYVFKNAFIWLLYEGSLETLKYVIEKGVDISNKKENLDYPIFYAIDGENLEIIKYMLEQKVDVNVKDSYNQTPLMRAAQNGNLKIMQLLINGGARVN